MILLFFREKKSECESDLESKRYFSKRYNWELLNNIGLQCVEVKENLVSIISNQKRQFICSSV